MIKRTLIILCLFLITSCSVNKKDLYKLTINEEDVYVGYSNADSIFTSFDSTKTDEEGILTELTLYVKDYDSPILINDIELDPSILINKELFEGYDSNGACVVEKKVHGKNNRIVFYNNILNDNLDELDHITIFFE